LVKSPTVLQNTISSGLPSLFLLNSCHCNWWNSVHTSLLCWKFMFSWLITIIRHISVQLILVRRNQKRSSS
jgi:hypothetical protein